MCKKCVKVLYRVAKDHGFRRKGTYLSFDSGEIGVGLWVQRSQWPESFYINFGVYVHHKRRVMHIPPVWDWPHQRRASELRGKYRSFFNELELGCGAKKLSANEAFDWLCKYLIRVYGDQKCVAQSIVKRDRRHPLGKIARDHPIGPWELNEWAARFVKVGVASSRKRVLNVPST